MAVPSAKMILADRNEGSAFIDIRTHGLRAFHAESDSSRPSYGPLLVSWRPMANEAIAFFAAVIAVATVAYAVFTLRLWEATEKTAQAAGKSADAATEAALAAKKSADLATALHRPFMGLLKVTLKTGWGTDLWVIALAVKNHGTLPAMNVAAMIEFFTANTRLTQITEPASVQMFPSDEIESIVRLSMPTHRVQIQQGIEKLRIEVRIPYQAEDGRQFEYFAEISYPPDGSFAIQKSETRTR